MSKMLVYRAALVLLALPLLGGVGCSFPLSTVSGPAFRIPMPMAVSPYFQKEAEDRFHNHERYERVPVLGPITEGGPPVALDPPSPDEVMRALEKADSVQAGSPFLYEKQRNNVKMIIEPIADYVDPPRVYPLVGPCQLHHAHYKCTIYYNKVRRIGWPVPHTLSDEDAREVIYIDHNHFHRVGGGPNDSQTAIPHPN